MTTRRWMISVSLGLHVVVVAAVFVAGVWRIEPLDAATPPFHVSVAPDPPAAQAGAQAAAPDVKIVPRKKVTHETVQPKEVKPEPTPEVVADVGDGSGEGSGSGSGEGSGDGSDTGVPGGVTCDDCHTAPPPPPVAAPPPPKPRIVPPKILKDLRISGETQIQPPDPTKIAMARDGVSKVIATLTICLGAQGQVTSATISKSSGYSAYDERLTTSVRAWQYRPFMVDGQGTPVCSAVTFIYRID